MRRGLEGIRIQKCSGITCKYDVNITTDLSQAYHTPCEIQSVVIASSAWAKVVMVVLVVVCEIH